jgi:3alpha(or 20beta)-hydroxysteroid dehydrogenase
VTGGTMGIGLASARACAQEGAKVAICARRGDVVQKVASDLAAEGLEIRGYQLDVSNGEGWKAFVSDVLAAFGRIDVLINNAGMMVRKTTLETSLQDWDAVMGVNLRGVLLGIQAVAEHMKERGGSIINIGSIGGQFAHFSCAYSVSKWGLRGLTKCAALDLAPWRIRVNAVHPSMVETPMADTQPPGHGAASSAAIPLGRPGKPIEIANCIVFLASDESSFVTAVDLPVDGGLAGAGLPNLRNRVMHAFTSGNLTSI